MSRNNLPENWDAEGHPSLEVLRQYQTGDLPAPLNHEVERHLISCELCSDLVEGMTLARPARVRTAVRETRGRLKNLLAQKKRKRKVFHWPIWQTAAVLLVLLFAIGEVVYHHYFARSGHSFGEKSTSSDASTPVASVGFTLRGHVFDSTGAPVYQAEVTVGLDQPSKSFTNRSGAFTNNIDATDSVHVQINHPSFSPLKQTVPNTRQPVTFILKSK